MIRIVVAGVEADKNLDDEDDVDYGFSRRPSVWHHKYALIFWIIEVLESKPERCHETCYYKNNCRKHLPYVLDERIGMEKTGIAYFHAAFWIFPYDYFLLIIW